MFAHEIIRRSFSNDAKHVLRRRLKIFGKSCFHELWLRTFSCWNIWSMLWYTLLPQETGWFIYAQTGQVQRGQRRNTSATFSIGPTQCFLHSKDWKSSAVAAILRVVCARSRRITIQPNLKTLLIQKKKCRRQLNFHHTLEEDSDSFIWATRARVIFIKCELPRLTQNP